MADSKRIVLVNEEDDEKVSVASRGLKGALTVEVVDSSGNQIEDFSGSTAASSVNDGSLSINVAGTAVQLSSTSVSCKWVEIQAHPDNSGTITIGSSTVKSLLRGRILYPTQAAIYHISNLNLLYLDTETANNKISYIYGS